MAALNCRICTLLEGKASQHNPDRLHTNAPARPIADVIKVGLAHLKQKRAARG